MPQKDDFLTRMMERMTQTLLTVTNLKQEGRYDEALARLDAAYREHTGSEGELVRRLPTEQLLALLSSAGVLDNEKALLIAELLHAEAEVHDAQGHEVPPTTPLKALDLYLEVLQAEPALAPRYAERVETLRTRLQTYELPPATERRLFEYHALSGHYARAEDQLFGLLERLGPDPELLQRGRRFYLALRTLPDERLEAGDLPREEVEEGLKSLEALFR